MPLIHIVVVFGVSCVVNAPPPPPHTPLLHPSRDLTSTRLFSHWISFNSNTSTWQNTPSSLAPPSTSLDSHGLWSLLDLLLFQQYWTGPWRVTLRWCHPHKTKINASGRSVLVLFIFPWRSAEKHLLRLVPPRCSSELKVIFVSCSCSH